MNVHSSTFFFLIQHLFKKLINLLIWLSQVLVVARGLSNGAWVLEHRLSSCGTWDLSSLTRHRACVPCIGRQSLNHWTTREIPIAALFIIVNRWKQPKYLSIDEWINKVSYVHTMEYYSAIKWNEAVIQTYTLQHMTLENTMLREKSQTKRTTLYMIPFI